MHITWDPPPLSPWNEKLVNRVPGVGLATYAKAVEIGARAQAVLAAHQANHDRYRKKGDGRSQIDVVRGSKGVDAFVKLTSPDERNKSITGNVEVSHALIIERQLNLLRGAAFGG